MEAKSKTRITITASYSDGHFLCREHVYLADTALRALPDSSFSVVELRIIVPSQEAEMLLCGIASGDTELLVEKMSRLFDSN